MSEVVFNPGLSGMPVKAKQVPAKTSLAGIDRRFNRTLDLVSGKTMNATSSRVDRSVPEDEAADNDQGTSAKLDPWTLMVLMGVVPDAETKTQGMPEGLQLSGEAGNLAALFSDVGLNGPQNPVDSQTAVETGLPEEVKAETVAGAASGITSAVSLAGTGMTGAWADLNPEVAAEVARILSGAAQAVQEKADLASKQGAVSETEGLGKTSDLQPFMAALGLKGVKLTNGTGNPAEGGLVFRPTLRQEAEALQTDNPEQAEGLLALATETADAPLDLAVLQTSKQLMKRMPDDSKDELIQINLLQQGEPGTSGNHAVEATAKTASVLKPTEVFAQIVERARVMVEDGASEMHLNLKPDSLGKIQLKVSLENQLISAKFVAESDQVKALIESNLVDLKRMLNQNGVQVDQVTVAVDQQAAGGENFDGQSFAGNAQPKFAKDGGASEDVSGEADVNGSEPVQVGPLTQIDLKA